MATKKKVMKCPNCGADLMHLAPESIAVGGIGNCPDCGKAYTWSMTPGGPVATPV